LNVPVPRVDAILAIPLPLRLISLFLLGTAVGRLINRAVHACAWDRPLRSPWNRNDAGAPHRGTADHLPVVGWLSIRRHTAYYGRAFWIRPLAVELFCGLALAGLYQWEVVEQSLIGFVQAGAPSASALVTHGLQRALHAQFFSHAVLLALMTAASLIDLDERQIPDAITVPGTLLGLASAAIYPWSLLPAEAWVAEGGELAIEFLTLASPNPWPDELTGWPAGLGLAIAIGCWTLWCGGVLPRRWNTTRGWRTAVRVLLHRLRRDWLTYQVAAIWVIGLAAMLFFARYDDTARWAALLSALVGMAAAGGIIWIVRFVGTAALRREAMGFGDVMLMSMIGTFIGWQGALLVFFIGPFFGLLGGLAQWSVNRENELPYGPYLCLAALVVIVKWPAVWDWGYDFFAMGGLLLSVLSLCLVLLGGVLWAYRLLTERRAAS